MMKEIKTMGNFGGPACRCSNDINKVERPLTRPEVLTQMVVGDIRRFDEGYGLSEYHVIRVMGGWIYKFNRGACCFVPFADQA